MGDGPVRSLRRQRVEVVERATVTTAVASWPGVFLGAAVNGQPVCAGPDQAVLVLGPPRSGKTTGVVIPSVLSAPGAVVSTSTKLDVLQLTGVARRRAVVRGGGHRPRIGSGRAPRARPDRIRSLERTGRGAARPPAARRGVGRSRRRMGAALGPAPGDHRAGGPHRTQRRRRDRRRNIGRDRRHRGTGTFRDLLHRSGDPRCLPLPRRSRRSERPQLRSRRLRALQRHRLPLRHRRRPGTAGTDHRGLPRSATPGNLPPRRGLAAGAVGARRGGQHRPIAHPARRGVRGRRPGPDHLGLLPGPVPGPGPMGGSGRRVPHPVRRQADLGRGGRPQDSAADLGVGGRHLRADDLHHPTHRMGRGATQNRDDQLGATPRPAPGPDQPTPGGCRPTPRPPCSAVAHSSRPMLGGTVARMDDIE
jgi:hypothetical protein